MDWQLQHFYHSSSPQRVLDRQLRPIIQHLQQSNINSLHQLKMQLQQLPSDEPDQDLAKTLPVFSHPKSTLEKFHSVKEETGGRRSYLTTKRNSFTLSPSPKTIDASRERVVMISPVSKVKKHLVERINIKQMKEALFKKRSTINRFQQFCEYIKERDRCLPQEKSRRTPSNTLHSELQLPQDKIQTQNDIFRITTRRKFWRNSRSTPNNQDPASELLNIRSFKTIDR